MTEPAVLVWTVFCLVVGGLLVWMWMTLRERDLQAELDEAYEAFSAASVRAVAAETRAAWLSSYIARLDQELVLERIVADAYASAIARDEQ